MVSTETTVATVYFTPPSLKGFDVMGKSSQAKGRRAELELVRLLQAQGIPAEPGQAVSYGATPDIVGVDGVHVEVKRRENVNLSAALAQAETDAQKFGDGLPAVFHRANRESWRVTMPLTAWLELYRGRGCKCSGQCGKGKGNPAKK